MGNKALLRGFSVGVGGAVLLASSVAVPAEWRYTIQRGDTLIGIAQQYLLSVPRWRELQKLNNIRDPRQLRPGATLVIPIEATRTEVASAQVKAVSGAVDVLRGTEKKTLAVGQTLQPGDKLQTSADSSAQLEFADGSKATVMSESDITLSQLRRMGKSGPISTEIELKRGKVESSVKPQPGGAPNYLIRTPSANLGVRGTEFRATAEGDIARSEVLKGLIDAANSVGRTGVPAGFGTVVKANEPPQKPTALLPAGNLTALPGQVVERLPVGFKWPDIKGAQGYRVLVARDATFAEVIADSTFTKPEAKFALDIPDGTYAVKVRAIDASQLEGLDTLGELRVKVHPLPPLTEQPSNKSTVRGDQVEFRWTKSEEAQRYRFQLAATADFARLIADKDALVESTVTIPLQPGEYFWRVASIRDPNDQGPSSQINRFTLKPQPAFGKAPAVSGGSMVLEWSGEPGQTFHAQLARNKNFSPLLLEQKLSEPKLEMPRPVGGNMYLRVQIIEADGFEGPFGPAQTIPVPGHDLNITYELTPQLLLLKWPAVLQPGWQYQWQLARDEAFTALLYDEKSTSSVPTVVRPEAGSYFARARVIDEAGEAGDFSKPKRIDIPSLTPWCCSP